MSGYFPQYFLLAGLLISTRYLFKSPGILQFAKRATKRVGVSIHPKLLHLLKFRPRQTKEVFAFPHPTEALAIAGRRTDPALGPQNLTRGSLSVVSCFQSIPFAKAKSSEHSQSPL